MRDVILIVQIVHWSSPEDKKHLITTLYKLSFLHFITNRCVKHQHCIFCLKRLSLSVRQTVDLRFDLQCFCLIRTTFFMKENKYFSNMNFFLPFAYLMILGVFFNDKTKVVSATVLIYSSNNHKYIHFSSKTLFYLPRGLFHNKKKSGEDKCCSFRWCII